MKGHKILFFQITLLILVFTGCGLKYYRSYLFGVTKDTASSGLAVIDWVTAPLTSSYAIGAKRGNY